MNFFSSIFSFAYIGYATLILIPQSFENSSFPMDFVNAGFAGMLMFVWWFTAKQAAKQQKEYQTQMQNTFTSLQNQISTILAENKRTLERFFDLMQEDAKYKALLAETLIKLEAKLDYQSKLRNSNG